MNQHKLVQALSEALPTVVFGDPMQSIFTFGGPMPNWSEDVQTHFPVLEALGTPWRWNNAGTTELGNWILDRREELLKGGKIDFTSCPDFIHFEQSTGIAAVDTQKQRSVYYSLLQRFPDESLLVIGNPRNPKPRHLFAQQARELDVVEPVELGDVINAASLLETLTGIEMVQHLLSTVSSMMTNVEAPQTLQRLNTIQAGRHRNLPSPLETALLNLSQSNSLQAMLQALRYLDAKPGTRIYRRAAFVALKDSISLALNDPGLTISSAAAKIRESRRHQGDKRIPRRAIGSTLLLKGLECDHVLITDAADMNRQHLYVALSRAAKTITVFSRSHLAGH